MEPGSTGDVVVEFSKMAGQFVTDYDPGGWSKHAWARPHSQQMEGMPGALLHMLAPGPHAHAK